MAAVLWVRTAVESLRLPCLESRRMDENALRGVLRANKAEALGNVEEFYCAGGSHGEKSFPCA